MSTQARARQKRSRPSIMARVRKGSTRLDPARRRLSKRFAAAASTAAATSGSTAMPKPASSSRPMRRPAGVACRDRSQAIVLRRQAHRVAIVGLRQHAHHQRRVGDGARHRPGDAAAIGRIDRHRGRGSASGRRCRTSRPAGGSSRRCRCRCAAARSRRPPPAPAPAEAAAGVLASGPTGCGSSAWKLDSPDDSMP